MQVTERLLTSIRKIEWQFPKKLKFKLSIFKKKEEMLH